LKSAPDSGTATDGHQSDNDAIAGPSFTQPERTVIVGSSEDSADSLPDFSDILHGKFNYFIL